MIRSDKNLSLQNFSYDKKRELEQAIFLFLKSIETRRIANMTVSGHECISYGGSTPRCYPYRLEILSANYGEESKRARDNLLRLCGNGTRY